MCYLTKCVYLIGDFVFGPGGVRLLLAHKKLCRKFGTLQIYSYLCSVKT